jgi:putative Holliday junction resolvase
MSRVVAIDLGTRRIGVAVTDALGLTAQPHSMIARHGGVRDLEAIGRLVREFEARTVVLGLPLEWDGTEGRAAQSARAFAARLQAALGDAVQVDLVDESYSTVEAEEVLLAADLSRAKRKKIIDKLAAAVILQRWLDGRRAASTTRREGAAT